MWLPSLVLWTKQTVQWLLCVCIFLSQRDKLLHRHPAPCTKAASALFVPILNLFFFCSCLWGIYHLITMPSDDLPNYVAYRWFYFPYGWEKQKMRDMFEALVKVITQKFWTLVNSLLNRKKENLSLDRFRILGPSWITLYFGRQHPGVDLVVRLSRGEKGTKTSSQMFVPHYRSCSSPWQTLGHFRALYDSVEY